MELIINTFGEKKTFKQMDIDLVPYPICIQKLKLWTEILRNCFHKIIKHFQISLHMNEISNKKLESTQSLQTCTTSDYAMHLLINNRQHYATHNALLSIGEWRHLVIICEN